MKMAVTAAAVSMLFAAGAAPIVKSGEKIAFMGAEIDKEVNNATKFGKEGDVSTPNSKIRLLVIPTNEELMIAKDTYELCK